MKITKNRFKEILREEIIRNYLLNEETTTEQSDDGGVPDKIEGAVWNYEPQAYARVHDVDPLVAGQYIADDDVDAHLFGYERHPDDDRGPIDTGPESKQTYGIDPRDIVAAEKGKEYEFYTRPLDTLESEGGDAPYSEEYLEKRYDYLTTGGKDWSNTDSGFKNHKGLANVADAVRYDTQKTMDAAKDAMGKYYQTEEFHGRLASDIFNNLSGRLDRSNPKHVQFVKGYVANHVAPQYIERLNNLNAHIVMSSQDAREFPQRAVQHDISHEHARDERSLTPAGGFGSLGTFHPDVNQIRIDPHQISGMTTVAPSRLFSQYAKGDSDARAGFIHDVYTVAGHEIAHYLHSNIDPYNNLVNAAADSGIKIDQQDLPQDYTHSAHATDVTGKEWSGRLLSPMQLTALNSIKNRSGASGDTDYYFDDHEFAAFTGEAMRAVYMGETGRPYGEGEEDQLSITYDDIIQLKGSGGYPLFDHNLVDTSSQEAIQQLLDVMNPADRRQLVPKYDPKSDQYEGPAPAHWGGDLQGGAWGGLTIAKTDRTRRRPAAADRWRDDRTGPAPADRWAMAKRDDTPDNNRWVENILREEIKNYINEAVQPVFQVDIVLRYNQDFSFYGNIINQIKAIQGVTVAKALDPGVVHLSPESRQIILRVKFIPDRPLYTYLSYLKTELKKLRDSDEKRIVAVQLRSVPFEIVEK